MPIDKDRESWKPGESWEGAIGEIDYIKDLATEGRTMLIVTHDLPYAAQLCDRAIIMDHGVIVADGAVAEVLSDAELLAAHRLELPWGFVVAPR